MKQLPDALRPKITLYPCCGCCKAGHAVPHSDPCNIHQRSLVPKKTRRRAPVETIETTEAL